MKSSVTTAEEATQRLEHNDSVIVDDTIEIKPGLYDDYVTKAVGSSDHGSVILDSSDSIPTPTEITQYLTTTKIASRWNTDGYNSVGGWEYSVGDYCHRWSTSGGNTVSLYVQPYHRISASTVGEILLDGITGQSKDSFKIQLRLARFLSTTDPDMFDFQYDKHFSMYQNLKDIHGIGKNVAVDLLKNYNCETYDEAADVLSKTKIPDIHREQAHQELVSKANSNAELVDEDVFREHSTLVVTHEI